MFKCPEKTPPAPGKHCDSVEGQHGFRRRSSADTDRVSGNYVLAFAEWLQTTRLSVTIQSIDWIIPLLQSIHILMIGLVFVSILMIALRVLGRVHVDEAFAACGADSHLGCGAASSSWR